MSTELINPGISGEQVVGAVVDIYKESVQCFTDYMKCKEHEKTERKRISACLSAITTQINAQKEVYLKMLDNAFEERKELYSKANAALKKATDDGDMEMLKCCFNYLFTVYNSAGSMTTQLINQFDNGSTTLINYLG